ncbi:MAG: ABC transporter ATP-binding protein, partial [Clostridia bacterium]|nr:ABC transporter ATP-binding protein [Clostridia bacterium]
MNNKNLPKGFENHESSESKFKDAKASSPGGPPMRRGPGGGPGAMGRAIEKPKDLRKTLSRLMTYFKKSSKLVFLLIAVVISVTLTSLITPAIQGSSIDAIKNSQWHLLSKLLIWLLISYGVHTMFSLFQSLISARLSQSIV